MKKIKLLHEAAGLAIRYHQDQVRKHRIQDVALPYVSHPFDVMKRLWIWKVHDANMLAAALMHDTLEDNPSLKPSDIGKPLGDKVLSLVEEMTFRKPANATKEEIRKAKAEYIASFARKSIEGVVLKLADRVCNVLDYLLHDGEHANSYFHKADALFETFHARQDEVVARFGQQTADSVALTLKSLGWAPLPQAMNEGI